jgi:hypothetical protein
MNRQLTRFLIWVAGIGVRPNSASGNHFTADDVEWLLQDLIRMNAALACAARY